MELTGLHILLTYECNYECEHCFVWGSPWQSGTLTLAQIRNILTQAEDVGTVKTIYFEGGEPFLYYPLLLEGVRESAERGFQVGLVTNVYWAKEVEDALTWLRPFKGWVQDLSISSDLYHGSEEMSRNAQNACEAADQLGIPIGVISVAQPMKAEAGLGQLPIGESGVMYRGRAADKLVQEAAKHPWTDFVECPYENLREPGRVHLDPLGYLHICQGISIGNLFQKPLREICETYDPEAHPIVGPLLEEGPVGIVKRYGLTHLEQYADACHLCYKARSALRDKYPEVLGPDQVYGVFE
jgi:MoaA/NifB/PqqE/SkfB family radical SAM enzyme